MGNDGSAMASGGGFSAPCAAPRASFGETFAREHLAQGADGKFEWNGNVYSTARADGRDLRAERHISSFATAASNPTFDRTFDNDNSFGATFAREHMLQGSDGSFRWKNKIYSTARADGRDLRAHDDMKTKSSSSSNLTFDNDNSFGATFAREHKSLGSQGSFPWNSKIYSTASTDGGDLRVENAVAVNCKTMSTESYASSKIKQDFDVIIVSSEKHGRNVVVAVINKVKGSPLADKHNMMLHIASTESNFGDHKSTFKKGYHGGIWQVDKIGFEDTKNVQSHPSLKKKHECIEKCFGIKWSDVNWKDLRKPLYSYLAARLLLLTKPEPIPPSIEEQAHYWNKRYNTDKGKGTTAHFIAAAKRAHAGK